MKITKSIDRNCKSMEAYFHKLFDLMQEGLAEEKAAPIKTEDANSDESQAAYHEFSHFIKPDMLMNVYSLVSFWLMMICEHQKHKRQLKLSYKDISGDNELHRFHRYLTAYAEIDLSGVQESYRQLDALRKIRNRFMHHGGHVPLKERDKYNSMDGVSVFYSVVDIEDAYVWSVLEHARKYLKAGAMA